MLVIFVFSLFTQAIAAPLNTLIIGNSHVVGGLGDELHKSFRGIKENNVRTLALAGASPRHFLDSDQQKRSLSFGFLDLNNDNVKRVSPGTRAALPNLSEVLKTEQPERLIIELGDNFAGYKDSRKSALVNAKSEVKKLFASLKDFKGKCYWVTPLWTDKPGISPYYKTEQRLAEVIKIIQDEAGSRCQVIDSTKNLSLNRAEVTTLKDGLHFGKKSSELWAKSIYNYISHHEAHGTPKKVPVFSNKKATNGVN
jgi:hypothetical protein